MTVRPPKPRRGPRRRFKGPGKGARELGITILAVVLLVLALNSGGLGRLPPYYPNCDAARAAGVAPIHEGEPGYRPPLDADGDGIACEPYPGM
jgi:hypothetical protein